MAETQTEGDEMRAENVKQRVLLMEFLKFLWESGYIDDDYWAEETDCINEFFKTRF